MAADAEDIESGDSRLLYFFVPDGFTDLFVDILAKTRVKLSAASFLLVTPSNSYFYFSSSLRQILIFIFPRLLMFSAIRSVARVATRSVAIKVVDKPSVFTRAAPSALIRSFRSSAVRLQQSEDEESSTYGGGMEEQYIASVTQSAPAWRATALVNGEFKTLSNQDFLGKWLVLFFYPLDFTFVCPTEIRAFSDRISEFEKLGVNVVAASVDSEFSHLAWTKQPKTEGGLGPMAIPILADITKNISRSYGVLIEAQGVALRGLFIVDPKGILRQSTINDLPVGRSVDETLRLIQAFQFNAKHGEVCPAGWTPGSASMKTTEAGLKSYFSKKQ